MEPKNVIGIYFADNDFYYTMKAFMIGLLKVFTEYKEVPSYKPPLTKKFIAELFVKVAPSLYWLYQAGGNNILTKGFDPETYFQIGEGSVCFDEDVDRFVEDMGGECNGEFWICNLDLQSIDYR